MPEPLALDTFRHAAGLQCELRLWLEARDPSGADPAARAEREAAGRARAELREFAAALLPGAERDVVFAARGLEARADFLVRETDGRLGLRAAGSIDPHALLRHKDVSGEVAFLARDLAARVAAQARTLASDTAPAVEPSPHCRRPQTCPFWKRCTRARPADWIGYLPGLRVETHAALREAAISRIGDVPEDFPLAPAQHNARRSLALGRAFAASGLARALAELEPEPDFLDFEAIVPEIPVFAGTRPFEPVPFQWSAHLAAGAGSLEHAEYLADGSADPRRGFAESLIARFAGRGARIAVYSSFESEVLALLARAFPELAAELERVRARLFDLLPVLRQSVYHPAFLGSFSLKRVAPVLASGFRFDDLPGIADGGAAARGWLALTRGELSAERGAALLAELRAYCARDSLALAELMRALRALVAEASHSAP